jgi:hypothetical protein
VTGKHLPRICSVIRSCWKVIKTKSWWRGEKKKDGLNHELQLIYWEMLTKRAMSQRVRVPSGSGLY